MAQRRSVLMTIFTTSPAAGIISEEPFQQHTQHCALAHAFAANEHSLIILRSSIVAAYLRIVTAYLHLPAVLSLLLPYTYLLHILSPSAFHTFAAHTVSGCLAYVLLRSQCPTVYHTFCYTESGCLPDILQRLSPAACCASCLSLSLVSLQCKTQCSARESR